MTTENRRDRVARLKRKFLRLSRVERVKEFVRYDRAKNGLLPHPFPEEYVEDSRQALWEMLVEDYKDDNDRLGKWIRGFERRPSEPFIKAEAKTPAK